MNPYSYEVYLQNMLAQRDRFIGPRQELTQLIAQVSGERPGAVLLLGPWGVGKSFLLQLLTDHTGQLLAPGLGFREVLGRPFRDNPERLLFVLVGFDSYDAEEARHAGEQILEHMLEGLLAALIRPDADAQFRSTALSELQTVLTEDQRRPRLHNSLRQLLLRHEDELAHQLGVESAALDGPLGHPEATAALDAHTLQTQCGELLERLGRRCEGDRGFGPARASLRLVFLIDDFDQVARHIDRERYDKLRALLEHVSMVIASSKPLSQVVPPSKLSSPFFQLLQLNAGRNVFNLFFLTPEDAQRLIKRPPEWAEVDFKFSDGDADFIIELAGLHHDAIRSICEYLFNYIQRTSLPGPNKLPLEHRSAFRVLLRQPVDALFTRLWRQERDGQAHQILARIARGHNLDLSISTNAEFARLLQSNFIVLKDGRFQLFAELFRDFVLAHAPGDEPETRFDSLDSLEREGVKEGALLRLLRRERGTVVSREQIAVALYKGDPLQVAESGRLEALVSRLRGKLRTIGYDVQNVRGEGYRLVQLPPGSAPL